MPERRFPSPPPPTSPAADGHFGLLTFPSERFQEASQVQAEFFKKWLSLP